MWKYKYIDVDNSSYSQHHKYLKRVKIPNGTSNIFINKDHKKKK